MSKRTRVKTTTVKETKVPVFEEVPPPIVRPVVPVVRPPVIVEPPMVVPVKPRRKKAILPAVVEPVILPPPVIPIRGPPRPIEDIDVVQTLPQNEKLYHMTRESTGIQLKSDDTEIHGNTPLFKYPHIFKSGRVVSYEPESSQTGIKNYVFAVGRLEGVTMEVLQNTQCNMLNNLNEISAKLLKNSELTLDALTRAIEELYYIKAKVNEEPIEEVVVSLEPEEH